MKLLSVNIQGDNHLEKIKDFLSKEKADIVCLMEVFEDRVAELSGDEYPHHIFAPNVLYGERKMGVAIFARHPILPHGPFYCGEYGTENLPIPQEGVGTHAPVVLFGDIGGTRVGAVHFSWTPNMSMNERQTRHVNKLMEYLPSQEPFILCGDFNIPRGNEMYKIIAAKYLDNIPANVETTIDRNLHRANIKERDSVVTVVDYLWSTKEYEVSEVHVTDGVSDHCGLSANVQNLS